MRHKEALAEHSQALAERDAMLATATHALREAQAMQVAVANRRNWEIVAHAAQRAEAAQAARAELAAVTLRFQTASQAIVAATGAEAAALRQQVDAASKERDAARHALAQWRRGGRLARMLRACSG
ncbi:hypothetical protein E2C06_35915 [Dankookia rubra]|uniref:Uncharacterized protein n=1 Tax=Dankookia rubra TaxID=1442381 RepID=A0A4V3A907_9PROT|nr:hypothetical protein [Dankookia rubra]TDH57425.1 hypothetical protein E2C06_35915 [Dankookia rubra]